MSPLGFQVFFNLTRFALGRLQFELIPLPFNYEKNGLKLEKGKTVINVHIPRTGTPMDKESCDDSYARANAFFKPQTGENTVFFCNSWSYTPKISIFSPRAPTPIVSSSNTT
ncbi:MAG: hypothetical protein IJY05_00610 [Clostridia bacterium]|nr:hypothetical protein [Clostridia bacterium]